MLQNTQIHLNSYYTIKAEIVTGKSNFYIFAPLLPDRLMAGLQILILTVLVRIQLGQLNIIRSRRGGFLFFERSQTQFELLIKTKRRRGAK